VRFTPQDEQFRADVREWLEANLTGEFANMRGAGGPGREHERHDERLAWNQRLATAGWTCLGWPAEHGGRGASLIQQVRHAGAARSLPAADPGRSRAVVPGLLRTWSRLRPGQRGHPGRPGRG
jgi:alkylation response protein AidB-like acyl-CoA dehydrogenase